jgi:hypothetical protein
MKKSALLLPILAGIMVITSCKSSKDPTTWNNMETDKWFEKHEWLNGWNVTPDASINKRNLPLIILKTRRDGIKLLLF